MCRPSCLRWLIVGLFSAWLTGGAVPASAEVTFDKTDDGVTVNLNGKLLTRFLKRSGNKPVLWPVIGPDEVPITRGYPIEPKPGETDDHPHQRGVWFTHGDVNGTILWSEEPESGEIRTREIQKVEPGEVGTISLVNDWLDARGKRLCEEQRTMRFWGDDDQRVLDFDIKLVATDGEVKLGDNKEGAFGLRVSDALRVEAPGRGRIITSDGITDATAWGQPARWVDYYAPIDGKVLGVAILDHPANPAHPVRWHVRPYGLFAANPFAIRAFDGTSPPAGITIGAGESLRFRYRVIVHRGDEKEAQIADRWAEFSKG